MLCSIKGRNSLVVWNPCTGQRVIIKPRTRYRRDDTYALGYTRSSSSSSSSSPGHSYKILRYWCYENDFVVECEIYELCSGSWRVLDSFTRDYALVCDGMSLKGNTYWVAVDKETGFFLMKFDFTTERFVRLPLPFQSLDLEDSAVLSVVKDEKLSVLHQAIHAGSDVMKIWVTNKVDDDEGLSWRSDFVLTVEFFKIDDIQFVVTVLSFVLDEENKVAVCCDIDPDDDDDKTRIYIVGEDNMYKQVYNDTVQKASGFSLPRVLTYVPRLLQINKRRH
ncbi:hypothetical protein N665_0045s0005 [Sinapis alba]|nr:hypothetical protein N665_0045s0005 [Sinapis alba]